MTESTSPPPDRAAGSVVVVGAGPCGLAMACELLQQGVPVRVLEAREDRAVGSRAVQLWPLGLEVLRSVGVLDEALRRGVRIHSNIYHLRGRLLTVTLGADHEPLMLPQEQTMELLEGALERLGGRVERGARVTAVEPTATGVTAKAEGPSGVTELVHADWLIGADGVHSVVREQVGIDFPGSRLPLDFLLAEGRIDSDLRPGTMHYYLGPAGSAVVGPMPGGRTRASGVLAPGFSLTAEAVQAFLDERTGGDLRVAELDTLGTFATAERIASGMRRGRVFLVGDAAHTHTPVGGQGLNLGLQDVHNLAWKLAGVINGRYAPAILDTYEPERLRAARQIVSTTHWMIKMFTLGPIASRVQNASWNLLGATGVLRRWFVPLLAGRRVDYPDALLLARDGGSGRRLRALLGLALLGLPLPGTRLPRWVPGAAPGAEPGFRLLTVGRADSALARRGRRLAQAHGTAVRHEHFRRRTTSGFLLLRPDGYVAASGAQPGGLDRLERLLTQLIAAPETATA
ncbi:FAD-dependent monooxygenase [Frankia sp. CNm7]|uniref:FAD-dependent monooxygenase n=1 Tax=Frankia nepalensis TaxID=1836974 RepID=A0A937URC8_9ACTN|nr:FAD-dependent monooxygenase [Frankia nepalensis]MBL7502807.1 FAD-dependent monooxygenase [Frankia nepalensis]MBL7515257.1 FAD-dependent monooxygenase [Frankia nepalensis]MBL7521242.1 FAD-dependent monooxygenase [Frankia nepalensis]MBL7629115.1 FAD-dependent monooxygenase [Frankia nepalensis]